MGTLTSPPLRVRNRRPRRPVPWRVRMEVLTIEGGPPEGQVPRAVVSFLWGAEVRKATMSRAFYPHHYKQPSYSR